MPDALATCTRCDSTFEVEMDVVEILRCFNCHSIEMRITIFTDLPEPTGSRLEIAAASRANQAKRQAEGAQHTVDVQTSRARQEAALRDFRGALFGATPGLAPQEAQELFDLLEPLTERGTADTVAVARTTTGGLIYVCQSQSDARARWADDLPAGSHLLALNSGQLCRTGGLNIHAEPMLMFASWLSRNTDGQHIEVRDTSGTLIAPFSISAIVASQPACVHCAILQMRAGIRIDQATALRSGAYYHSWACPWSDGPIPLTNPYDNVQSLALRQVRQAAIESTGLALPNDVLNLIGFFAGGPVAFRRPVARRDVGNTTKKRKKMA